MNAPRRHSPRELRAMAFALADEIETRALAHMAQGMPRRRALALAIDQMAKG